MPPVGVHNGRNPALAQIRILVTTDAENYQLADISGSSSGVAIRERIFTKVRNMNSVIKFDSDVMAGSYIYPTKIRNTFLSIERESGNMRWGIHF